MNAAVLEIDVLKGDVLKCFTRARNYAKINVASYSTASAFMGYQSFSTLSAGTDILTSTCAPPGIIALMAGIFAVLFGKEAIHSFATFRERDSRVTECGLRMYISKKIPHY